MNIDFSGHPFFSAYIILLLFSGIAMVVLSALNQRGQTVGWRIFGGIAGLAFFGYGVYLGFFFTGGTYLISVKVILLPIMLIVSFVRSLKSGGRDAAAPQQYAPQYQVPPQPGQPYAAMPQQPGQPYDAVPQQYVAVPQQPADPYGQLPQYNAAQAPQPPVPPAPVQQPPVPPAPSAPPAQG